MTKDKAFDALNLFLDGDIDLDALEDRVVPLAWDSEYENQDLVDIISIELVYIKDGISDEPLFRERVVEAVSSCYGPDVLRRERVAHEV